MTIAKDCYEHIKIHYFNKYGFIDILKDNWIKTTAEFFIASYNKVDTKKDSKILFDNINKYLVHNKYLLRRPVELGGLEEVEQWDDYVALFSLCYINNDLYYLNWNIYNELKNRHFNIDQRDKTGWSLKRRIKERIRCTLLPFQTGLMAIGMGLNPTLIQNIHLKLTLFLDRFKGVSETSGRLIMYLVMQNYPDYFKSWNNAMIKKYKCKDWYQVAFNIYYSTQVEFCQNILGIRSN